MNISTTTVVAAMLVANVSFGQNRGEIGGDLAGSFSPAAISRGVLQLPLPLELPNEYGAPLWNVFPSYSTDSGMSEWGMGWQASNAFSWDTKYQRWVGPWGAMKQGDGGVLYALGLNSFVRVVGDPATTATAFLPDGRRVFVAQKNVIRVENAIGQSTEIGRDNFGRVSTVDYGGVKTASFHPYRVKIDYLPSASSVTVGERVINSRVSTITVSLCSALNQCTATRWHYTLEHAVDATSTAISYLASIQKHFAAGGVLPAQRFAYYGHSDALYNTVVEDAVELNDYSGELWTGTVGALAGFFDDKSDGLLDVVTRLQFLGTTFLGLFTRPNADSFWQLSELKPLVRPAHSLMGIAKLGPAAPEYILTTGVVRIAGKDDARTIAIFNRQTDALVRELCVDCGFAAIRPGEEETRFLYDAPEERNPFLSDVDGDGWPDIVQLEQERDSTFQRVSRRSVVVSFNPESPSVCSDDPRDACYDNAPLSLFDYSESISGLWFTDIDADGTIDALASMESGALALWTQAQPTYHYEATGTRLPDRRVQPFSAVPVKLTYSASAPLTAIERPSLIDANRDGLPDLLFSSPNTQPRLFINAGTSHSGGREFREITVGGLVALRPGASILTANLLSDGSVAVFALYPAGVIGPKAEAKKVVLSRPENGLLASYDNGLGTKHSFGYDVAPVALNSFNRPSVLATVRTDVTGEPTTWRRLTYKRPFVHSTERRLLAFDDVDMEELSDANGDLLSKQAFKFYSTDDSFSLLQERTTSGSWNTPVKHELCHHEAVTSFGIAWQRLHDCQSDFGTGPVERTVFTYDVEGICVASEVVTHADGQTLSKTTSYERPAAFADTLSCLPSSTLVSDSYEAVVSGSPSILTSIVRRPSGQVERVSVGPSGRSVVQYQATYDEADEMLLGVSYGGIAGPSYVYELRPRVSEVRMPDGTSASWSGYDATTNQPRTEAHASGYRRCFSYDRLERVERSWDNVVSCDAEIEQTRFAYQLPSTSGTLAGLVRTETLQRDVVSRRTSAVLASAAGSPIAAAQQTEAGWAIVGASTNSIEGKARHRKAWALDLVVPNFLATPQRVLIEQGRQIGEATVDPASGLPLVATQALHQNVERTVSYQHQAGSAGIDHKATENGANDIVSAQRFDGAPSRYVDEQRTPTTYQYDASGRLRSIALPDTKHATMSYDDHGRIAMVTRELADHTIQLLYAYDGTSGLPRSVKTLSDGVTQHYEVFDYDRLGRLTLDALVASDGVVTTSYVYFYDGAMPPGTSLGLPLAAQRGRLTGIAGDSYTKALGYRADGRLERMVLNIAGKQVVDTGYAYFDNGEPRAQLVQTYQPEASEMPACLGQGTTKEVVLDALGRTKQLLLNDKLFVDVDYDATGRPRMTALADGSYVETLYDPYTRSQIGTRKLAADGTVWESKVQYSARGLIARETQGATDLVYAYDNVRSLDSVSGAASFSYQFNPNTFLPASISEGGQARPVTKSANMLTMGGSTPSSLHLDALGRVDAKQSADGLAASFVYGKDGQIRDVCAGANPGCCNAAGNFCNQPHFSYIYDEAGQRLAKVAADGSIVSAFSAAGVFGTSGWTEPFQSQGAVLGLVDKGGLTPFDADVRGTMLAAAGQSVERPSPFGHRRAQPAVATASAFIGQPFEPSLGAMRLGVRDYDPEFGIFMQPDPLFLFHPEACVNDPMSCSLYTYGHNDPVNHVDPSGLADETVSIGTGGGDAGGGAPASPPLQYCFILCFDSPSSTQSPDAGGTPYRPMPAPPPRTLADFSNVLGGSYAGPGSLNDGRGNTMFAGPPGAGGWGDYPGISPGLLGYGGMIPGGVATASLYQGGATTLETANYASMAVNGYGLARGAWSVGKLGWAVFSERVLGAWAARGVGAASRAGYNGVQGPVQMVTRVTRDGSRAARIQFPDKSILDVSMSRVKEFIQNLHPKAPPGSLQRVIFDDAIEGTKGLKRVPGPECALRPS